MHRADLVKESAYGLLVLAFIADFLLARWHDSSSLLCPPPCIIECGLPDTALQNPCHFRLYQGNHS